MLIKLAQQLYDQVEANSLGTKNQSAYKAKYSTETALFSIQNDVCLALSRGEATAAMLLDLSAAFDTIDHNTLIAIIMVWYMWVSYHMVLVVQLVLSNARKFDFLDPQYSHSILLPFPMSLPTDYTQLYVQRTH